eukprot:scaffold2423_cov113-Isochrysis_galbana.AAC.22
MPRSAFWRAWRQHPMSPSTSPLPSLRATTLAPVCALRFFASQEKESKEHQGRCCRRHCGSRLPLRRHLSPRYWGLRLRVAPPAKSRSAARLWQSAAPRQGHRVAKQRTILLEAQ